MAFQISYIFEFKDKYSAVAADMLKKMKHIDKSVKGLNTGFDTLNKVAPKTLNNISDITSKADAQMKNMCMSTKKQTRSTRLFGAVVSNLKYRIASLIVSLATAGFGMKHLIDKETKVNKAFTIMSALTGIVGKDFDFLEKKSFRFARVFGIKMEDVATSFKRVAGLKPELLQDVEGLAELTKWTLILDAPMDQIEKVSRALTVSLNVYGKTAKSSARFTNILAAAQRKGSAEVIDMALSFLKAGPVAETAKVPFIELVSAIQSLARSGVLRQMAGTSLRTIMIRVADYAKKQGQSFVGALKSIEDQVLSTEGALERISLSGKIFGKRQASAGLILLKNIQFMDDFKKSIEGTNIALDTAKKVLTSYERESQKTWSVWDLITKEAFKKASPALLELNRQFVAFITQLSIATPGGLGVIIITFSKLLSTILQVGNALLLVWNIITSPLELVGGWDEFIKRWENIGNIWELMNNQTPQLESIINPDEISGVTEGNPATGDVNVNVNFRGNTEDVESASVEIEGTDNLNAGLNFAF